MKNVLHTVFYGNIWIATGAAAGAWQTAWVMGLEVSPLLLTFIFLATLFCYNFDRYVERLSFADSYQKRHQWLHEHRRQLAIFTILPGIAWVVMSFWLSMPVITWLLHLGLISVGYSVPLWRLRNGERFVLRKIGFTKPVFVAYVWAAVCVGLPVVANGYAFDSRFFAEFIGRFFFILALCLPFDLRDEPIDRSHGMQTLPVLIGRKPTEWAAYILLLIQPLLLYPFMGLTAHLLLFCSLLYAGVSMRFAIRSSHDLAYSAGIDGAIVLQAVLMAVAFAA